MMYSIQRLSTVIMLISSLCFASPVLAADHSITGLWQIEVTPDGAPGPLVTNLAQMDKEGVITNSDPFFGTGLGRWERVEGQTYAVGFTHYFLDAGTVGTVTVEGILQLAQDKQALSGPFHTTITIDGFVVEEFGGTLLGTRE